MDSATDTDTYSPRGFKGLKQAVKLEYKLGKYDKVRDSMTDSKAWCLFEIQAIEHYAELLTYVKSAVTRNYSEKSINNMLDFIEKGAEDEKAYHCMEKFYSQTLESFQSTNNERLWLKTNIKLARLWLDRREYTQLVKLVRELHRACQKDDGTDDPSKGTYALEIYALEIQMYAETRNNKRLKVSMISLWSLDIVDINPTGVVSASSESQIRSTSS